MKRSSSMKLAGLALALGLAFHARGEPTSQGPVKESIENALGREKIDGLSVDVQGATVGLSGRVRNVFERDEALEIALSMPEVEAVETDIEISRAESDQALGQAVVAQLRRYSRFTVFDDASAYVEDGGVVLVGWVTEPFKKTELERRLHDVIGIREFRNEIEVLPTSSSDARLRRVLANRLYRDPTFSDFASMPIPPVHIIVERSRVILTGVVNSRLMKQKAESIVRGTPGVLSLESRLRVGR